ncbi:MAG TPA: NAD-dependent epimerase/dehydratase family protein [Candidatus Nanoarchaeia archaeon]|nr:NAD-dependent epimerase/dehydratase family protein [Candidatus Nanoarchaeia archaeon]
MKIMITGGSGLIGSELGKQLGEHEIINYDLKEGKDITNKEQLLKNKNIDVIIHLAANTSVKDSLNDDTYNTNINGSHNVLELARKNDSTIVFASSSVVYKPSNKKLKENDELGPISNYGASKAATEMMIHAYNHSYGIKSTIVRLANIYGRESTKGVIHDLHKKLLKDASKLEVIGDGEQRKSYLHVSDCTSAIIKAWQHTKKIETYNIAHDETTSVKNIVTILTRTMKIKPTINYTGKTWTGDITRLVMDNTKIKKTGWKPKISIKLGIREYVYKNDKSEITKYEKQ